MYRQIILKLSVVWYGLFLLNDLTLGFGFQSWLLSVMDDG